MVSYIYYSYFWEFIVYNNLQFKMKKKIHFLWTFGTTSGMGSVYTHEHKFFGEQKREHSGRNARKWITNIVKIISV